MNVRDKLNLIKQQLYQARSLSGQARASFEKVESGSEQASSLLGHVSKDVFEAGLANGRGALTGAGQRAEEALNEVKAQHEHVVEGLEVILDADPAIQDALAAARTQAESLGLPTNETWLLRNAIDSAQREEGYAAQSTGEIDKSLWGIEGELNGVLDNATELGTAPRGRQSGMGRMRRRHQWCGSERFRERWQARIQERRNRARDLDQTASRLDNPFDDMDRSADRGARHQLEVGNYVDQALRWADELDMKFSQAAQPPASPTPAPPSSAHPAPAPWPPNWAPTPTAPIPTLETPAPPPPPPPPPPTPEAKPEGFFKKPWRGARKG